jgi:hypothetical protein
VAKQELGLAEARGDQLLQPQRGGGDAAGKLRHEGNARGFDPLFELQGFVGLVDIEGGSAVNAFAIVACGKDGERSIPLRREDQNDIHVVATAYGPKSGDFGCVEIAGRLLGQMRNLAADRPDFKPVGKSPQGGAVSTFPGFT